MHFIAGNNHSSLKAYICTTLVDCIQLIPNYTVLAMASLRYREGWIRNMQNVIGNFFSLPPNWIFAEARVASDYLLTIHLLDTSLLLHLSKLKAPNTQVCLVIDKQLSRDPWDARLLNIRACAIASAVHIREEQEKTQKIYARRQCISRETHHVCVFLLLHLSKLETIINTHISAWPLTSIQASQGFLFLRRNHVPVNHILLA